MNFKRKIFIKLILFLLAFSSNAQSYQWAKNFGSSINTEGKSIVVDQSGFVYTAINNIANGGASGFENFSIKKQNSLGNELWTVAFSSSGSAFNSTNCQSITVDLNGNLYITGYHRGIVNYNGTTILTPTNNNSQAFIVKLNTNGGLVWSKSLGNGFETIGNSIGVDSNFNVYTTGYYTGSAFGSSAIGRDIFIIKHDSNGNQKWLRRIGGAGNDISTSISIDLNNNVLTTGYYSDVVDFDPGINTFNLTSTGKDIFISKLDSNKYITDLETEGQCNYAFIAILKDPSFEKRDNVEKTLKEKGIEFRRGLSGGGNQLRQPYFKKNYNIDYNDFKNIDHVHHFSWYVGNYPTLGREKIDTLINVLNSI
jgi:hypothetical protein